MLLFVFHLNLTTFSFNLYIENCRYLDIVTVLCKQTDKGRKTS